MPSRTPTVKAYNYARGRFAALGHDWRLSLEEWQALWETGDYSNRGKLSMQWEMRRKDDSLPWTFDNCVMYQHASKRAYQQSPQPVQRLPRDGGKPIMVNGVRTLTVRQWADEVRAAKQQDC